MNITAGRGADDGYYWDSRRFSVLLAVAKFYPGNSLTQAKRLAGGMRWFQLTVTGYIQTGIQRFALASDQGIRPGAGKRQLES